jgi:protoheme ferro-lyase
MPAPDNRPGFGRDHVMHLERDRTVPKVDLCRISAIILGNRATRFATYFRRRPHYALGTRSGQAEESPPGKAPLYAASQRLAAQLGQATGYEVIVGFNEFCTPDLDEALDQAAARGTDRVVVATPIMTTSGEHAEADISDAVAHARERHPRHLVHLRLAIRDSRGSPILSGADRAVRLSKRVPFTLPCARRKRRGCHDFQS